MALTVEALQDALTKSAEGWGLPGASVAVYLDGQITEAATGVINLRTGVATTTDTLFQIGSVTKMYTTTMIMQLVDAGSLDLDQPLRRYLPEFRVADQRVSEGVTLRHLLTHTAGFDGGDWFFVAGRGDDALERYVASLTDLKQLAPMGEYWSYNNSAFAVLGRVIEVVTGKTWDAAARELLLDPAELTYSVTLPEQALLYRTAAGHQLGSAGQELVTEWGMDRGVGPMGGICASAADVVGFARIHLEGGRGVLSAASVKAMQEPQIRLTGDQGGVSGLGWHMSERDGVRVVGHGGATPGQYAFFEMMPDRNFAIVLLTNGPTGRFVWLDVAEFVTTTLGLPSLKQQMPDVPADAPQLDLNKYVGRYERNAVHHIVTVEGDKLMLALEYVDIPYDMTPPPPMALTMIDATQFVVLGPDGSVALGGEFLNFDDAGVPEMIFVSRLARRA